MTPPYSSAVPTPLGALRLVASEVAWVGAYLPAQRRAPVVEAGPPPAAAAALLAGAARECEAWLAGDLEAFSTPIELRGTPFQRAVWEALRAIPWGECRSYGWIARRIDRPAAVRAVGAAVGRNPLSIVVPCHRVVGADGSLTGYAGGLDAKRWLLAHEARTPSRKVRRGVGRRSGAPTAARGRLGPGTDAGPRRETSGTQP